MQRCRRWRHRCARSGRADRHDGGRGAQMLPVHGDQAAEASLVPNFERRCANIVLSGRPVGGTEAGDMSAFAVTFFETFAAQTKRDESLSLDALADRVRTVTAATKEALPLLKLARFGNARSAKGSLRHDRNVIA